MFFCFSFVNFIKLLTSIFVKQNKILTLHLCLFPGIWVFPVYILVNSTDSGKATQPTVLMMAVS